MRTQFLNRQKKLLLTACSLFITAFTVNAQTSPQTMYEASKHVFAALDKSSLTTGILLDQGIPEINPARYCKSDTDTIPTATSIQWQWLYQELYYGRFNETWNTPNPVEVYNKAKSYRINEIVPIATLFTRFHRIRNEEQKKFFTFSNGQLLDTIRTDDPYDEDTLFVTSVLKDRSISGLVRFALPQELFYTNVGDAPATLYSVDLGDGIGPRLVDLLQDGDLEARYLTAGTKTITAVMHYNGKIYTCKSTLEVENPWIAVANRGANCPGMCYDAVWDDPSSTAEAYIKYGSSCEKLSKPMIFVEGFDAKDEYNFTELYFALNYGVNNSQGLIEKSITDGYDVIILNFKGCGGADMRDNGRVLERLINYCNNPLYKSGAEKLVVAGHSMGGVISRWILRKMELESKNHNTRLYISSDAPHQGANIPLGAQQLAKHFNDISAGLVGQLEENYNAQNSTAARQLLLSHFSNNGLAASEHTGFYSELQSNGYPNCERACIALGSPDTKDREVVPGATSLGSSFNPGDEIFNFSKSGNVDLWIVSIGGEVSANIWANNTTSNFMTARADALITIGYWDVCWWVDPIFGGSWPYPCWKTSTTHPFGIYEEKQTVSRAYDHPAGGLTNTQQAVANGVNGIMAGSSTTHGRDNHCIVPTYSALDIGSSYSSGDFVNQSASYILANNLIPFTKLFMYSNNNDHAGAVRPDLRNFMTTTISRPALAINTTALNNTTYNFGSNTPTSINKPLSIENNGKLYINKNQATAYGSGASPSANSIFNTGVIGCSNVTIANTGLLELGDVSSPASYKGIVSVSPSSFLSIASGGKLVINNQSKLIVEPGATLIIESGAIIELKGNDAVLEINGNLQIAAGATFTFTGSGYVKWGSSAPINGGAVSSFILQGVDENDKVLEVTSGVAMSHNATLNVFKVASGKIVLGTDAYIKSSTNTTISNAYVTGYNHKGLWLSGEKIINIEYSYFEGGQYGIYLYNRTSLLAINSSEFSGNEVGIRSTMAGILQLNSLNLNNNAIGWQANANVLPCDMNNCKVDYNETGVSYTGGMSSPLSVNLCLFSTNTVGLDVNGWVNATFHCGEVSDNEIGIQANDHVMLNVGNTDNAGKVLVQSNTTAAVFNNALMPQLNLGYNEFHKGVGKLLFNGYFRKNGTNNPVIDAMVETNITPEIPANENNWRLGRNPVGGMYIIGTSPASGEDYRLYWGSYPNPEIGNNPPQAKLQTLTYTSGVKECDFKIPCPKPDPRYGNVPCLSSLGDICSTCDNIYTVSFKGVQLNTATNQTISALASANTLSETNKYLSQLGEILTATLTLPDGMDMYMLQKAYRSMKETIGKQAASGVDNSIVRDNTQKAIDAIDYLLSQTSKYQVVEPIMLEVDKALSYRLVGERLTALTVLAHAKATYPNSPEKFYADFWECILSAEQALSENTITDEEFVAQIEQCNLPTTLIASMSQQSIQDNNSTIINSLDGSLKTKVYPNPINGTITTIDMEQTEAANVSISLYDVTGKLIREIQKEKHTGSGLTNVTFENSDLANGIYYISINTGKEEIKHKLVVVR